MSEEFNSSYMKRLETEYNLYQLRISDRPISWYMDHAKEMMDMKNAYEYLKSNDLSQSNLNYLMQAKYPIRILAEIKESFEDLNEAGNPMALTFYDICKNRLLDHTAFERYKESAPIVFQRKPATLAEMRMLSSRTDGDLYQVEKIIELTSEGFEHFTESLISDFRSLQTIKIICGWRRACIIGLLITTADRKEGVLVESEGFDYARYCADVPNMSELEIGDVPVEKYGRQRGRNRTFEPPAR